MNNLIELPKRESSGNCLCWICAEIKVKQPNMDIVCNAIKKDRDPESGVG